MKIKLVSLLKICFISFFIVMAGNANAEYYLVYSDAQFVAGCDGCAAPRVRHHYYGCHHHRYHHRYYSRSRSHLDMRVYYVWRVYPAPGCNTGCGQRSCRVARHYYAPCSGGCNGGYYMGDSYVSSYDASCYRNNCRPGYYCNSCSQCQYQSPSYPPGNGYYSPNNYGASDYSMNNDYNWDMRTADDYR